MDTDLTGQKAETGGERGFVSKRLQEMNQRLVASRFAGNENSEPEAVSWVPGD